ncbi:MAG: SseB family protein [Lentisphaeria bacterium]|jgi:hypothetical protein
MEPPLTFEPLNELETKLQAVCQGRCDFADFGRLLLLSKLVVALDRPVPQDTTSQLALDPLRVKSPKGYSVLAAFTHPSRVLPWREKAPAHTFLLMLAAPALLKGANPAFGLALNPGWPVSLELPPHELDRFLRAHRVR